jgi:cytoskeleton protein RodZ
MQRTARASEEEPASADGVGEFLRRERELRHISLDEVAERTKISRRYLEAIEAGRYERLPGETFVRGFIRSYAQSVGLDPDDTLLMYSQARGMQDNARTRAEHVLPEPAPQDARSLLWLCVVGLIVVGGVLFALFAFRDGFNPWPLTWPRGAERTATPTGSPPLTLTAIAGSDTWLRVTIDDREVQDVLLRAGQSIKWIGRERFVVSIGNARATRLLLDGREIPLPHLPHSILRHYTISRDMLQ